MSTDEQTKFIPGDAQNNSERKSQKFVGSVGGVIGGLLAAILFGGATIWLIQAFSSYGWVLKGAVGGIVALFSAVVGIMHGREQGENYGSDPKNTHAGSFWTGFKNAVLGPLVLLGLLVNAACSRGSNDTTCERGCVKLVDDYHPYKAPESRPVLAQSASSVQPRGSSEPASLRL